MNPFFSVFVDQEETYQEDEKAYNPASIGDIVDEILKPGIYGVLPS
jgi:hypothetical protein